MVDSRQTDVVPTIAACDSPESLKKFVSMPGAWAGIVAMTLTVVDTGLCRADKREK